MKKTITKPDGTTEVIEGSPEEIRRYESAPAYDFFRSYRYIDPNCAACNERPWWGVSPVCTCGRFVGGSVVGVGGGSVVGVGGGGFGGVGGTIYLTGAQNSDSSDSTKKTK